MKKHISITIVMLSLAVAVLIPREPSRIVPSRTKHINFFKNDTVSVAANRFFSIRDESIVFTFGSNLGGGIALLDSSLEVPNFWALPRINVFGNSYIDPFVTHIYNDYPENRMLFSGFYYYFAASSPIGSYPIYGDFRLSQGIGPIEYGFPSRDTIAVGRTDRLVDPQFKPSSRVYLSSINTLSVVLESIDKRSGSRQTMFERTVNFDSVVVVGNPSLLSNRQLVFEVKVANRSGLFFKNCSLVVIDSSGKILKQTSIGSDSATTGLIVVDPLGYFYISYDRYDSTTRRTIVWMEKRDMDGNVLMTHTFPELLSGFVPVSGRITKDGDLLYSGVLYPINSLGGWNTNYDRSSAICLKLKSDGEIAWYSVFDTPDRDDIYSDIIESSDGTIYALGNISPGPPRVNQKQFQTAFLSKFNPTISDLKDNSDVNSLRVSLSGSWLYLDNALDEESSVEIIDLMGRRQLLHAFENLSESAIDLTGLGHGVYIARTNGRRPRHMVFMY